MKIRRLTEADEPLVSSWLEQDPVHQKLGLTFRDVMEPQTEPFLVSDDGSNPLLAVRLHLALRMAIQFDPQKTFRSAKYAPEVIDWAKQFADGIGAKEIIIRPGGGAVHFANKLGFEDFIGKYMVIK